uniref:hypothetical protein n=1 Tax=Wolbachia endosymbiont of Atemnus politus TaxID=2682840 RepID=UPI001FEC6918|nr:hypothetical protein [Wolbachia endosymbiont of Atemnus politus]
MRNRREYTTEFKLEAKTGQPSSKIARDLGISGDLRKYNQKMSGAEAFSGKGKVPLHDNERFDLNKELARVTR